jgi:hypothetical protein
MAIYPPTPRLSSENQRMLALLSKLLVEHPRLHRVHSNVAENSVALSDAEANELLSHIRNMLESRDFAEASHFVETVTQPGDISDKSAREIYLSGRAQKGRSRAMASSQWEDFKARLGFRSQPLQVNVAPMDFGHFARMEQRLLAAAGIDQQVVGILMQILTRQLPELQKIRDGRRHFPARAVKNALLGPFERWYQGVAPGLDREVSTQKLGAVMLVVADGAVLFTTRDWGVAGTLSTMAGVTASAALD